MISFSDLVVRYPRAVEPAVNGVTVAADNGQLTAIVGPNGSGKSTLVRALLGRVPVAAGSIALDGDSVEQLSRREIARRMAVVVQREEPVFPMRVSEYIALGRYPELGAWGRQPDRDDALRMAATAAGIGEFLGRTTDQLSGGEWQRVRVARALVQGARTLVLDEPTAALDIGHEMEAFELMAALASAGRCMLVISHQLNLVARFAHRVALLKAGRVVALGSPDDVMRADVLEGVYEYPLLVARDPVIGAPTLVPLRRPSAASRSFSF
ncbi:MAG: ABC transporter ATP-binding protein [Gemmatimonadaceae bacterium]